MPVSFRLDIFIRRERSTTADDLREGGSNGNVRRTSQRARLKFEFFFFRTNVWRTISMGSHNESRNSHEIIFQDTKRKKPWAEPNVRRLGRTIFQERLEVIGFFFFIPVYVQNAFENKTQTLIKCISNNF